MNAELHAARLSAPGQFPLDHLKLLGDQILLRTQRGVDKGSQVVKRRDVGRRDWGGSVAHELLIDVGSEIGTASRTVEVSERGIGGWNPEMFREHRLLSDQQD